MNKIFCVTVALLASVFFMGISTSAAGDLEVDGSVEMGMAAPAPTAVSDSNYIKEVYAATEPGAEESATKVFSVGDTVYLTTRYYVATPGNTSRFRMLSDASGAIKGFYGSEYVVPDTGSYYNSRTVTGLSAGVYYFTTVILASGNHMISPDGYLFIVE